MSIERSILLPGAVAVLLAGPAALAAAKEPPSCAKIEFRPVPSGQPDGEANAGMYRSRFGRIEVKATVKTGEPQDYFVVVDGKKPPAAGKLPPEVAACAAQKRLPAPGEAGKPGQACAGERFAVLVSHAGAQRLVLLYGRRGTQWQVCSAGAVEATR
jgi:hypothetical protein